MLEDYRRIMVDRRGEEELFTSAHIANCMNKGALIIDFHELVVPSGW